LTGALAYDVIQVPIGDSIDVTVSLPPGSNPTGVFKDHDDSYVDESSLATVDGNVITLNLTDGGAGDADGVADGTIVDPVVAVRASSTSAPFVSVQPVSRTASVGQRVSFWAAARGRPIPTTHWQVSTNGGASYTTIGGATKPTYSVTASSNMSGNLYRAVFANGIGSSATSAAAKLTVRCAAAPSITSQPSAQTVTAPAAATFTAAASTPANCSTPRVQWYSEVPGATSFTPIPGATSARYKTPPTTTGRNATKYRATFTNAFGSTTTKAATLGVMPGTKITKSVVSQAQRQAKFSFTAIGTAKGFECALVKAPASTPQFKSCRSPKAYSHLTPGRYTFELRALSATGRGAATSVSFRIA